MVLYWNIRLDSYDMAMLEDRYLIGFWLMLL